MKIKYENFDPLHVKIVGKKKVNLDYFDMDFKENKQKNEVSNLPHQDLLDRLDDLAEEMCHALGILPGWDYARDHAKKDGVEGAMKGFEAAIDNTSVTEVWFFGDSKPSIQLAGSVITPVGAQTMKTPRISLEAGAYPFSENLALKLEELKVELWAYLFNEKFTKKKKKGEPETDPNQIDLVSEIEKQEA